MAGIAGDSLCVIGSHDLGESLGFGAVRLVAAAAYDGRVQLWRLHACGIVRVLGLRTVAGFARNNDVLALLLQVENVGVAAFTDFVPGMRNGAGCDLSQRRSPVVAVLPEALRHDRGSKNQENTYQYGNDCGKSDQMLGIFEQLCLPARDRSYKARCSSIPVRPCF